VTVVVTRLVAVFGVSPGIGKSTLAELLARRRAPESRVDLFHEEDILSRAEFAEVAEQFRTSGVVDLSVLLDASARFVSSARKFDVVVTDALFPFVPSLLAWGHDEHDIRTFVGALHDVLRPLDPVVVFLDGDAAEALQRASVRSGAGWLTSFIAKLGTYMVEPRVRDFADAVHYLRREREVTLRALSETGWKTIVLGDADRQVPDDLAAETTRRLEALAGA
jgi:hypothetical protein